MLSRSVIYTMSRSVTLSFAPAALVSRAEFLPVVSSAGSACLRDCCVHPDTAAHPPLSFGGYQVHGAQSQHISKPGGVEEEQGKLSCSIASTPLEPGAVRESRRSLEEEPFSSEVGRELRSFSLEEGPGETVGTAAAAPLCDRGNPSFVEYSPSTLSQVDHERCNGARLRAEHVNVQKDSQRHPLPLHHLEAPVVSLVPTTNGVVERIFMKCMRDGDVDFFARFYRITPPTFDELHDMVKEDLTRQFFIREPLPSEERLAIALSYLSSGQQIKDVALLYRVGLETARQAVHVTCRALWERLHQPFMKTFHNHIPPPPTFVEVFLEFTSVVLPKLNVQLRHIMCVFNKCRPKIYRYNTAPAKHIGRSSFLRGGPSLLASEIGQGLDQGTLNLPKLGVLPGCQKPRLAPYAFVGDEAFQLRTDFLRPYPAKGLADERRAYNYRLSRARCAENAFGIMSARWRILLRTINLLLENVDYVVKSCCVLHNFLLVRKEHPAAYADQDDNMGNPTAGGWCREIPDSARELLFPLEATRARNFGDDADFARKMYMYYFCSPAGEVSWQRDQPGVKKQ
ncbi:hypothetical protein HPB47_017856, partial [Ixodes persulcatus]